MGFGLTPNAAKSLIGDVIGLEYGIRALSKIRQWGKETWEEVHRQLLVTMEIIVI